MKRSAMLVLAVVLAACPACAEPNAPAGDGKGVLTLPHIRLDLKARQIVMEANVCLRTREVALEFLVCGWGTKEHESILTTKARASQLHAMLLMLGLRPGLPAEVVPTAGDANATGRFLPPRGAGLKITLRWKDPQGRQHQADAAQWLAGRPGQQDKHVRLPKEWIFVGSEVLPGGGYGADMPGGGQAVGGEIVSVANFSTAVIDVPFESSSSEQLQEYYPNTDAIPEINTRVEIVIQPLPGAQNSPYARAMLEIDRLGGLKIDGQPIKPDQLDAWATGFLRVHPKARVVIRTDPRALAADLERARWELEFAGVSDIQERRLLGEARPLPRTAEQAEQYLQEYRKAFAKAEWMVPDPVTQAREELAEVDRRLAEMHSYEELLREYRRLVDAQLKAYLAEHPADANRPASGGQD